MQAANTRDREPARVLVCIGTRPEAIKLAPVIAELRDRRGLEPVVCLTAQHRDLLDQVLDVFTIDPDHDLDLMRSGQGLDQVTADVVMGVSRVIALESPAAVVVQGDTTTAFASALAAFYAGVPVGHVEAGLRTYDPRSPFPEEMNRRLVGSLATWHFAPTERAAAALLREGVDEANVFEVGNTVIDALESVLDVARSRGPVGLSGNGWWPSDERRFVLVTGHRRESFGLGLSNVCEALRRIALDFSAADIVYPVHPNPNVVDPVREMLGDLPNVHLVPPLDYLSFVWLMERAAVIVSDSGGVQEEAPYFGTPVLVTRACTERMEAIEAGVARLVGTNVDSIVREAKRELSYTAPSRVGVSPFGDGKSVGRIVDVLSEYLEGAPALTAT